MENQLKHLVEKFIWGKTNKTERKNIRESVSQISDKELEEILSDIWDNYNGSKAINEFNSLMSQLRPHRKKIQVRSMLLVAASFLICIMMGLQVYYYMDNQRLSDFISQEVTMKVESGERTDITLPDGTTVALNAGTTISYSVDYGLVAREVKMAGEAFLDVVKNPNKPFRLNTEYVSIEVLGTKFNVSAYSNYDLVETVLVEGSVKLTTKGAKAQTVTMSANDKAVYSKKIDQLSVTKNSTTYTETAWLDGKLVFRSAQFKEILEKLELRYGVKIFIDNMEKYNTDLFTGTFKEDSANGILKILQLHYNFTYTNESGDIHIILK